MFGLPGSIVCLSVLGGADGLKQTFAQTTLSEFGTDLATTDSASRWSHEPAAQQPSQEEHDDASFDLLQLPSQSQEPSHWPPSLDPYVVRARTVPFKAWFAGSFLLLALTSSAYRSGVIAGISGEKEPLRNAGKKAGLEASTLKSPKLDKDHSGPSQDTNELQPPAGGSTQIRAKAEATLILLAWMVMSPFFIIYNKWLFSRGGFPYPVTLTAMHMGSCFVIFGAISWLPKGTRLKIMPDVDTPISWEVYFKGFVPAALFMAMGLGFGNVGFLYASVVFIQLVKPVNVVITSLASFVWGLEVPTVTHMVIVMVVSGGVILASVGSVEFSMIGLVCQLIASTSEGFRLIILQGVMQTNLKLDPLTTVYRFAPLAGLTLCCLALVLEKPVDVNHVVSFWLLALNCASAVLLNVIIALVIARTSAVVSVLTGVTKDILTISVSAFIYSSPISGADCAGYGLSLSGICMYKVYKDNLDLFVKDGLIGGSRQIMFPQKTPP